VIGSNLYCATTVVFVDYVFTEIFSGIRADGILHPLPRRSLLVVAESLQTPEIGTRRSVRPLATSEYSGVQGLGLIGLGIMLGRDCECGAHSARRQPVLAFRNNGMTNGSPVCWIPSRGVGLLAVIS